MTDNELLLAIGDLMDRKLKSELQAELQPIKDNMQELMNRMTKIELHLENVTDKNIQFIAENYAQASKRYMQESAKIEAMQADIDVMKSVIREHSEKLQKIS